VFPKSTVNDPVGIVLGGGVSSAGVAVGNGADAGSDVGAAVGAVDGIEVGVGVWVGDGVSSLIFNNI